MPCHLMRQQSSHTSRTQGGSADSSIRLSLTHKYSTNDRRPNRLSAAWLPGGTGPHHRTIDQQPSITTAHDRRKSASSSMSSPAPSPSPPPLSPGWRPGKFVGHIRDRRRARRRQQEQAEVEQWQREQQEEGEGDLWEDDQEELEEMDDGYEYIEHEEGEDVTLDEYDALRHRSPRRKDRVRVQVRASPPPSAAAASAESGGGGWYLGKLTGRVLRRGLLALVGEEEAQRRRDGAPVVARLRVRLKGVRGLRGALNPYLEVICEGTRRVVKPSHFREDGAEGASSSGGGAEEGLDPEWSEAVLTFAVTDITTNVHVLLLDKRPLRTLTVGRLILPLTNLMGASSPLAPRLCAYDLVAAESIEADRKLMYQKYAPQMAYTPPPEEDAAADAAAGLPMLSVPVVGQLVMELGLETVAGHNLFQTYLLSRPLLEDSFLRVTQRRAQEKARQAGGGANPDDGSFSTRQLAINVFRVRRALQPPPLLLLLLDHPALFHPPFALLAWRSPYCLLPLHLLLLTSLNGLLAARAPTCGFVSVEAWPEPLVERVLQLESTSAPAKLRKLRRMVKWLQDQLGLLASGLERSAFLLSWADPHVTLPVHALLTLAALVATFVLYLLPPRLLLWLVGVGLHARLRRARQAKLKAAARAAGTASPRRTPRTPKTQEGEEELDASEEEEEGNWQGKVVDLDWRDWLVNPARRRALLPSLMKNVVARTPDLPEVIHREIAKRRAHQETVAAVSASADSGVGSSGSSGGKED